MWENFIPRFQIPKTPGRENPDVEKSRNPELLPKGFSLRKKILNWNFFYIIFLIIFNELFYQIFSRLEVIMTVSVIYRVDFLIKSDRWNIDDSSLDRTWNRSDFSRSKIKKKWWKIFILVFYSHAVGKDSLIHFSLKNFLEL